MARDTGLPQEVTSHANAIEEDSDVQLMLRFQQGSEEAFVQLYERHRDRVFNVGRRLLGSQADGEEVAQEVFLKVYQSRARYRPLSRFSTYLLRIAVNHSLHIKARHEHAKRDPKADAYERAGEQMSPEELTGQEHLRRSIARALAQLPDKQGAAFVLCHFEGYSCRHAADVLEVSEGAVKQLLFRARNTLASALLPHHTETEPS